MEFVNHNDVNAGGFDGYNVASTIEKEAVPRRGESKNIDAERRRRAKHKKYHHALRSLVPNISKMSKEATLSDAADYIRELQGEIRKLEEELQDSSLAVDHKNNEVGEDAAVLEEETFVKGEVDLNPIGRNTFHVRMICKNKWRRFVELVESIGNIRADLTNVNFVNINGTCEIVFCLQVENETKMKMDDLKCLLQKML